ncbi:MAG: hypothetical protein SPM09_12475 [Fibrobacter sp.]|uniref:hypothetical protein n=1 Tax=Fibrobacter sp. TaxID=35828 RepID=UPI002A915750|nr:hypothetical protein [Fibrobacter sp.]MBR6125730.1 hypothetical protein [Candidatus Saccharibacteria bacterium]MDY6265217.1 hypothetical protein [Fibrobacter sp.]
MGSDASGLFSGTRGSANSPYHRSAEKMQANAKTWAAREKERLGKISERKKDMFNTASIVYDNETGRYFYGKNGGIFQEKDVKNPQIFGKDGVLPSKSLNGYDLGNCAEVQAINKALNSGAKMENLYIFTMHTTPKSFGSPKPACKNCTYAFRDRIKKNHTGWTEL